MQLAPRIWIGSDLSDAELAHLAQELLKRADVSLLPALFAVGDLYQSFWRREEGQLTLIGILQLLIDTLDGGDAIAAVAAMDVCPKNLAQLMHHLLAASFFADGVVSDAAELDDAVVLCLALLDGARGHVPNAITLLDEIKPCRTSSSFRLSAEVIARHFAPSIEAFKPKLIIWDLDDTLWQGTLADGDKPVLNEVRANFVRALNRRGIVSAICSKNDFASAKKALEGFDLWDEFVFPRIAFVPKGAVIKQMIADMQLRPVNVLFIDDNPHNLHEVIAAVPGIHVMDATSGECDALLQQIFDDNAHVDKNRVADYRLIETKVTEREENALSDEDFLLQSEISAVFTHRMDNLEFADRIEELINRSNQLNYTQSRVEPGTIRERILDIDHYNVICAFVWDKYGYYGLVGVVVFNFRTHVLEHLAFSCRVMHMGIEDALIKTLGVQGGTIEAGQLKKPLPSQTSGAIAVLSYADPAVRARILAAEAPRDWSRINLRIMADCQSGALHHYSRFRDDIDFDNAPRVFSLPTMHDGSYKAQSFPKHLVYTAANDYVDWRWKFQKLPPPSSGTDLFQDCLEKFVKMIVDAEHHCLLLLPPQDCPIEYYVLNKDDVPEMARALHPQLNHLWRAAIRHHPDRFTVIELGKALDLDDMVHAHHYTPSALKRIAGIIDDWYVQRGTVASGVG